MKSIRFSMLLILAFALAACAPGVATEVVPPSDSPTPTTEISVLVWERSGGFAGFCDKVTVQESGSATVFNCKGEVETTFALTESQRAQLTDWMSTYQPIDFTQSDPAVADAMTISLVLAGNGAQQADNETIYLISQFAADLAAQASANLNAPPERNEAETTLYLFLNALSIGDTTFAAKLYNGETELLETWNPDIVDDLPKLLERACTQNGLVCMAPRTVTYQGLDADGNYQFLVEFTNPDGALFVQGPCCGETEGPTFSNFLFRVMKTESGFAVLDLPPYVP